MNRREFLSGGAAGLAMSAMGGYIAGARDKKPLRVGLIGTGWYGKSDLLRLIQVSPVEVVSLCDVDQRMLEDAGKIVASRQASHKTPRLYRDYREMLKHISECQVANRPGRFEPRVIKRRRHGYKLMQEPRAALKAKASA